MHTKHSHEKQDKMASEQGMIHWIAQAAIKSTKVAIMSVREADNPVINARPIGTMPRLGCLVLRQSTLK